jgi:GTP-binding protein
VSQEEPDEDLEGELDVEGDQAEAAEVPRRGRRRTKAEEILATLPSSGIVAVVGRPNVGKSTLFNRLVGKKTAIVHDEPGVTRDRHYGDVLSRGRRYTVVDTGGFDPESEDPMRQGIKRQIDIAIAEADLIVCVLDATLPPTGADYAEIDLLRRSEKPVIYVANKADSAYGDRESNELYRLGIERVIAISALHGRRLDELEAAIDAALPKDRAEPVPVLDGLIRVALVGRPNAGKSSLVNRLAGEERSLVDARPGTTRDPVDTVIEQRGKRYVLIDTAGIRRKAKVAKEDSVVEAVSVLHAIRAMERADLVVLLCDAADGVSEQDAKILGLAEERGRAIIIVLNKIDLCDKKTLEKVVTDTKRQTLLRALGPHACGVSAKTGRGVDCAVRLHRWPSERRRSAAAWARARSTASSKQVLATHPPPTSGGRAPRLYFVTQAETCAAAVRGDGQRSREAALELPAAT